MQMQIGALLPVFQQVAPVNCQELTEAVTGKGGGVQIKLRFSVISDILCYLLCLCHKITTCFHSNSFILRLWLSVILPLSLCRFHTGIQRAH